ncbi:MAG: MATE family efflux transporter [Eubacterium sp.]|nr:MATE family efflux transporter [Eubacterium sp.]
MDKNKKAEEMETKPISKLILSYSSATFFALFFDALYNIVDTLFISHGVGDNAMGGVSVIFPFMMIQAAIAQMVGGGAAALTAKHLGEKDYRKAGSITANAMLIFYSTAVITTVLGFIFMTPILRLSGVTDDISPYAKEYFSIILIGNVFSTGFSSIIRAEGRMGYSLAIWLIPTAVNIFLDYIFISILDMGVKGAALATVIGYFTSFLMSVIFFTKISCQDFNNIKINFQTAKDIVIIGIPTLIQMSSMSLIFLLINRLLSKFGGSTAVNTFAYISKIAVLAVVPVNAAAQAVSPIISYNYGADNKARIKSTVNFSLLATEAYSLLAVIAVLFIPKAFIRIFTDNYEIINEGSKALQIISPALIFIPLTIILSSYFQSTGQKTKAIFSSAGIIVFLLILLLILPNIYSVNGIWMSIAIACMLSAVLAAAFKIKCKI